MLHSPPKTPMETAVQQAELHSTMLEAREQIAENPSNVSDFQWVSQYMNKINHHLHGV